MDVAYLIFHRVNMDGAYIRTLHFFYTLLAWLFHRILPSRLFKKMFSPETNQRIFFFLSYISWETRWSFWFVGVKLSFFLQHGKWSYLLTATEKNGCFHKAGFCSQMTPLSARDSKKYLKKIHEGQVFSFFCVMSFGMHVKKMSKICLV